MNVLEQGDENCIKNVEELIQHLNDLSVDKAKLFLNDLQDDLRERMGEDYANNPIGAVLAKGRKEIWWINVEKL